MSALPGTFPVTAACDADTLAVALTALRDAVREHAVDTIHRVHCFELAPRWLDASLRRTLDRAPVSTQLLFRLLCFGEAVDPIAVTRVFGAGAVTALDAAGVLDRAADGIRARHRLEVVGDQLLLTDWPDARATGVYFGEDSEFLRSVLQPQPGDVCLDLCTGSGVQAMRCAPLAARVDAVDVNPAAVRLARMNAVLNGVGDCVTVHEGDLWNALPAAARWDHVVCNPPLVPVPEAVPYPVCGHGGADGLDVVRRILSALDARLTARGRCTLIGACTGTAEAAAVQGELAAVAGAGMSVQLFLLLRTSLRDWVRMLADTVSAVYPGGSAGNTVLRCRARYGAAFDTTWVYTFLVRVERGGPAPGACRLFDYSTVGQRSYWFVNRGRVAP